MIKAISNWTGELIIALVVVTIIEMLLPENKIKKYVKTVIGIYIIFCIISPFINQENFLNILKNEEKNLQKIQVENKISNSQNSSNSIEDLYIQELEKDVTEKVKSLGYKVNKCEVSIQIDASKENAGINSIHLNVEKASNIGQNNLEIEDVQKVEISINPLENGENNDKESNFEDAKQIKEFLSNYYEIDEEKIIID